MQALSRAIQNMFLGYVISEPHGGALKPFWYAFLGSFQ